MNFAALLPINPVDLIKGAFLFVAWVLAFLVPLGIFTYAVYFLVTLPWRRRERARLFLDLLETRLGQRPETLVVEIARCKDRSLGARFHLLASYLETGLRLGEALDKVPRFLPPQINAMLKAGEEIGDISKVLPACRRTLQDADSQVKAAFNYLILVVFAFAPFTQLVFFALRKFVIPKYQEIFNGMTGFEMTGGITQQVFAMADTLAVAQFLLTLALYFIVLLYLGGPRLSGWGRRVSTRAVDRLQLVLPWKRLLRQRDFGQMLCLLLDAGLPEAKAIELAANSSSNIIIKDQARAAIADLSNGKNLQDALLRFSNADSFHWRLKNAFQSRDFPGSLQGWFEHLEAKAFQQEQATAHLISTAFVIGNGVLLGLIVVGMFQMLVTLVNKAVLW